MKRLGKSFFEGDTLSVAKSLLGKYLVVGNMIGRIVETEAYLFDDAASHSFNGKTLRNSSMFENAGTVYVYFTYGMYHCFNVVTNKIGVGEAVLIRAIEPVKGVEEMKKNRGIEDVRKLCNGPAKLTIAFGIDKRFNGSSVLNNNSLIKLMEDDVGEFEVVEAKRIGIKNGAELPYRFFIRGNDFVSFRR